jgi:hypothetical protein
VCAIFQASSAGAVRAFTLMNNIKTRSRNKFEGFHVEMLLRIKSYLSDEFEVDLDAVYSFWKRDKKRRQKLRGTENSSC